MVASLSMTQSVVIKSVCVCESSHKQKSPSRVWCATVIAHGVAHQLVGMPPSLFGSQTPRSLKDGMWNYASVRN